VTSTACDTRHKKAQMPQLVAHPGCGALIHVSCKMILPTRCPPWHAQPTPLSQYNGRQQASIYQFIKVGHLQQVPFRCRQFATSHAWVTADLPKHNHRTLQIRLNQFLYNV
jgi:hypothetical protein